jgi:pyridoxine kinase
MKKRAIPAADVITPNQFELDYLSGQTTRNLGETLAAVDVLHALGPCHILVTSLHTEETPGDCLDLLASGPDGCFRVRTPLLPISINGAGDLIAALFFAHLLRTGRMADALKHAVSSVYGVLKVTADKGSCEILLVEAQDELVAPRQIFECAQLR